LTNWAYGWHREVTFIIRIFNWEEKSSDREEVDRCIWQAKGRLSVTWTMVIGPAVHAREVVILVHFRHGP